MKPTQGILRCAVKWIGRLALVLVVVLTGLWLAIRIPRAYFRRQALNPPSAFIVEDAPVIALVHARVIDGTGSSAMNDHDRQTKSEQESGKEHEMNWTNYRYLVALFSLTFVLSSAVGACGQSQDVSHPPAQIQSLEKALVGHWSTTYEFEPGGMGPNAKGTGSGVEVWRTSPGGFVLMEEEDGRAPFGQFFVFAIHWWDKSTNSLRGMLCNNSGPAACNVDSYTNSTLKWDGKQLTIDMQFPEHGKKMLWHEVWSDITPTSFTQTGDVGEIGGQLKRAVTIHGTKAAGHEPSSGN